MKKGQKWIAILAGVVILGSMFADRLVGFYTDWLWFGKYGYKSVLLTILGAQFGFGLLVGGLFFLFTYVILKLTYRETSHLPVVLSDQIRREVPILDLIASNLKPLVFFVPLILALMTGVVAAQQWDVILKYFERVAFNAADPIFGKDYSFYLFTLPFLSMIKAVIWEALVVIGIGTGLIYFFKRTISIGPSGFVLLPEARRTLSIIAGLVFLMLAFEFYLSRFNLLLEGSGVVEGINYADNNGRLPILTVMIFLSLAGVAVSFINIFLAGLKKILLVAAALGIFFVGGNFYPSILQKFVVAPNELIKETPYIEHTIAATQFAFGLDKVETQELTGSTSLTAEDITKNAVTIENIRLWDEEPLLDTLSQIQEIRTYYQFASVDNDRYYINGNYQQSLLSPRELLSSSLPNRTWINEHLTFTHGYGVSLSPVNQITTEGMPVLLVKDIPPQSSVSLKITRPEIYFGELTNDHVFVNTGTKEFDYPEGEKNVYKNYEGSGGITIGSFLNKILFAARFKTIKILFSQDIENESRLLMYRNITDRVQKIAPFLRLDRDPYMVITQEGRLVWMYDAYTVSDRFPYSSQMVSGFGNYLRNSVKITIDAYEGSMNFYIADQTDPIILTYQNIFPDLFKPIASMPEDLQKHIRYPQDLFTIQTLIHATYHMETPQVFYNKEDQWEIPEIDGKMMEPYYTIMKLPGGEHEEYIQMLPFTPRGKSNLSAWMVARSDDEHYGNIVMYTFPKQKLIYGPNQIVARINQNAEISRQISLWDQRGSKVIQGNLLVIPIEESLIYVRPLYLKADAGKIPELKRVIVGYEDQIAMEPTLEGALQKIFGELIHAPKAVAEDAVAGAPKETVKESADEGNVVLSRRDYLRIKRYFERALASQKQLDQVLSEYRSDLEGLGTALEETQALPVESRKTE